MQRNLRTLSSAALSVLAAGAAEGQSSTLLDRSPHASALEDFCGSSNGPGSPTARRLPPQSAASPRPSSRGRGR